MSDTYFYNNTIGPAKPLIKVSMDNFGNTTHRLPVTSSYYTLQKMFETKVGFHWIKNAQSTR